MRFAIVLSSLIVVISSFSHAQSKTLHKEKSKVTDARLEPDDGFFENVGCDAKGNVFVTVWNFDGGGPADRPLLMFDRAGRLKASFKSGPKDLGLSTDFLPYEPTAPVSDGGVARLIWSYGVMSVDTFSADGKLKSKTLLDPPAFIPYQLAVFPSGESLVSGLENVHSRRALAAFKSFTAIYSKDGHLLRKFAFPEDAEIDAAAEIGDSRYANGPMFGNHAVVAGAARMGVDGSVYLMRRTSPATVYVISSSGELLRTLKIEPPDVGQMPLDMRVAEGRIAIRFGPSFSEGEYQGTNFIVADATTGEKLSDDADESVLGVFACYSVNPERFTFLDISDDHKLQILEASVR
jgi:hypothetical protein